MSKIMEFVAYGDGFSVYRDIETRVQYIIYRSEYLSAPCIAPRYNADGTLYTGD